MAGAFLQPLLDATPPIPVHATVAVAVAGLGTWQVIATKGTRRHRVVGWLFVLGMTYVALSALFISELRTWGYFSPIHLLIPVTLFSLWVSVRDVRRGNIKAHAQGMISLFVLAIVVTGLFTLMPGRVLHKVFFPVAIEGDSR